MNTKFTQDVVPLTDLKANPGKILKRVAEEHRPVLLTSRGRGVAVAQSVVDYEQAQEEREFMRAVVNGLADFDVGLRPQCHLKRLYTGSRPAPG
jgi:prevent-host-death family protein